MSERYDVVVIGGGMVGAALACALGGGRLSIAVIEGNEPPDVHSGDPWELRVSAITAASQHLFVNLGAWPGMVARRVSPYREMHVWDATGDGVIHFDSADAGLPFLGHIVENNVIQRALWERMGAHENIRVHCPAALAGLYVQADHVEVRLADGRALRARLVVGADGARSRVRELAGIGVDGWSYEQHAVVTTVHTSEPHRETAWQRFMPDGPLAFLPLNDGQCSIVWSTTPRHAAHLVGESEDAFLAQLRDASDGVLGRMLACGPRAAFPLRLRHAREYVRPRIALIGDAAHTVHPLAGQGVNLGLLDAAALACELSVPGLRDPGSHALLRRYERARKGHNMLMLGVMDGFKRLFGSQAAPLVWARNTGLKLTDNAGLLKNLIIEHAMGFRGDLPPLTRGWLSGLE